MILFCKLACKCHHWESLLHSGRNRWKRTMLVVDKEKVGTHWQRKALILCHRIRRLGCHAMVNIHHCKQDCRKSQQVNICHNHRCHNQSKLCSKRINAVLLSFSFWDAPAPRPPKHIYELRSYILKPGTMIEWGSHWARGINYRKTDEQAVGGFFSQIGRLYMVFHFWAYKDLEARKRIREDTWQKPGWDVNVTYTVPLIKRMRSRIMVPTSFSPMQ